jgi:hypothetical protein
VADKSDDLSFRTVRLREDDEVQEWYWLPGTAGSELLIVIEVVARRNKGSPTR